MKESMINVKTCENQGTELSLEKQLEKVIAAWESDSKTFEKLDEEVDLEYEMFTVLNHLENNNLINEIEKLDRALQCQPQYYEQYGKYISQSLIPLYLAKGIDDSESIKNRIIDSLKPFYENPVDSSEILFNVLDKIICFDQSSIAVDLCKKSYAKIAESDDFFINPKDKLGEIIIFDGLQDVYIKFKKNIDVDWLAYDKNFKTYGYQFTQENYKSIEEVMQGRLDPVQLSGIFKNKAPLVLFLIRLAFCCQMYDLDGTSFVVSNNFASKVINCLSTIKGREKCHLHVFFKIQPDFLEQYVFKMINNEWFESTYKQFALLNALPIFYLVLLKIGILEMKALEGILPATYILKSEYEKIYVDKPWTFSFCKKLEKQASSLAQTYQE